MESVPAESEKTEKSAPANAEKSVPEGERKRHAIWLVLAAIALVAAFLSQWKNSLDMAAIASTDDGRTVRIEKIGAEPESGNAARGNGENFEFRILLADARPRDFAGALLCDDSGKILARLEADFSENSEKIPTEEARPETQNRTRLRTLFASDEARADAARERFLRFVLPALRDADGEPIVLVLPN